MYIRLFQLGTKLCNLMKKNINVGKLAGMKNKENIKTQ